MCGGGNQRDSEMNERTLKWRKEMGKKLIGRLQLLKWRSPEAAEFIAAAILIVVHWIPQMSPCPAKQ